MPADMIFPNNNEEEFISIAAKLGYDSLYFIYDLKNVKKIDDLQKKTKIKLSTGVIAKVNEIHKAKKTSKLVLVKSSDNNRRIIEKSKNLVIFGLEDDTRKDYIHHRASGLNQVLCKLANKNNIKIGFSFNLILNSNKRSKTLGRIKQNIKLCRKYKVKITIASFAKNPYEMRAQKDLISLFVVLGMHHGDIKETN